MGDCRQPGGRVHRRRPADGGVANQRRRETARIVDLNLVAVGRHDTGPLERDRLRDERRAVGRRQQRRRPWGRCRRDRRVRRPVWIDLGHPGIAAVEDRIERTDRGREVERRGVTSHVDAAVRADGDVDPEVGVLAANERRIQKRRAVRAQLGDEPVGHALEDTLHGADGHREVRRAGAAGDPHVAAGIGRHATRARRAAADERGPYQLGSGRIQLGDERAAG